MAVQANRTSKTRKRLRRTHFKISATGLVTCPHCGAMIKAHHVCPHCGYYAGKQILKDGKYYTPEEEKVEAASGKKSVREKKASKKAD